jgi:cytochrome c-type biogenesis protein CcmE
MNKGRETAWQLEDCEARVLITWDGALPELGRPLSVIGSLKHICFG